MEVGTLEELDVKPGDVVECVDQWYTASQPYEIGRYYTVNRDQKVKGLLRNGATGICASWRIVSRASDSPKLWRDMTDAEKGAILLADHDRKVIECWIGGEWMELETYGRFFGDEAYRVKPEPVRDTVEFTDKHISFASIKGHRITFDLIGGEPDCDSIKMEKL